MAFVREYVRELVDLERVLESMEKKAVQTKDPSALLAGSLQPQAGVDYGKLATDLPKLRAQIEYINQTLFKDMTPSVFMTLIDVKPDFPKSCSHLTITKAERDELVRTLTDNFGATLNAKNSIYGVADASLLKFFLVEKGYRCSDEPWL